MTRANKPGRLLATAACGLVLASCSTQPPPGEPLDFSYRLHWQGPRTAQQPPGAWVTQSRVGRGYRELADDEHQFIVDFMGPSLAALPSSAPVKAMVSAPANGVLAELAVDEGATVAVGTVIGRLDEGGAPAAKAPAAAKPAPK